MKWGDLDRASVLEAEATLREAEREVRCGAVAVALAAGSIGAGLLALLLAVGL